MTKILTFPCSFPMKVIGENHPLFIDKMVEIILRHVPSFDASGISFQLSKNGRYISMTAVMQIQTQKQLDALYQDLSSHEMTKFVL